jgi:hypothetical protein
MGIYFDAHGQPIGEGEARRILEEHITFWEEVRAHLEHAQAAARIAARRLADAGNLDAVAADAYSASAKLHQMLHFAVSQITLNRQVLDSGGLLNDQRPTGSIQ